MVTAAATSGSGVPNATRVCRAAWLVGVTIREYREMEAGDRVPEFDVWDRLCELCGGRRRS